MYNSFLEIFYWIWGGILHKTSKSILHGFFGVVERFFIGGEMATKKWMFCGENLRLKE